MEYTTNIKEYIKNSFTSSDKFMSVVRDGIRYIYEAPDIRLSEKSYDAELIGICARGEFYYMSEKYRTVGKDFMSELTDFEQLYNAEFDKQMKRFSAQKPIGGKIPAMLKKRLEKFRESDMERVARDLIYGAGDITDKNVDHSYYEPLFLRYLILGNKDLENAVAADINEHSGELNFAMISEDMAYKRVAELLQDNSVVESVSLYGRIKQSGYDRFRVAIGFKELPVNDISIDKATLLRMIKYNEKYTLKKGMIIQFSDIIRISHEEQILFEKTT